MSSTEPPTQPQPFAGRAFTAAVRGLLILGVLLCGYLLLRTYRDLFSDLSGAAPLHPDTPDLASGFVESLLQPGAWHFAETAWTLSRFESAAAFDRPVPPAPEGPADAQEREALTWLRDSGKARPVEGGSLVEEQVGPVRVRAWTHGERLRAVRLGWQHDGDRWIVFEVRPAGLAQAGNVHLLTEAESVARRWDAAGRLDAELVKVRDFEAFLGKCRSAGWETKPLLAPSEAGIGWRLSGPAGKLQVWALPAVGPVTGLVLVLPERGEAKR